MNSLIARCCRERIQKCGIVIFMRRMKVNEINSAIIMQIFHIFENKSINIKLYLYCKYSFVQSCAYFKMDSLQKL